MINSALANPFLLPAASCMNVFKGILLKLISALLFAVMSALIRGLGDIVPVEQYNSVRTFFEKIRAAEQAPVVLARKQIVLI